MKKLLVVFMAGGAVLGATVPQTAFGDYWRAASGVDQPEAPMAVKPPKDSKAKLQRRIGEYEGSAHATPKTGADWFELGIAYAEAGKPKEAAAALRSAVKLQPGNGEAWNRLGAGLIATGSLDESIDAFRRVVEIEPKSSKGWNNLGLALIRRRQLSEAEEDLNKAHDLEPGSKVVWNSMGALRAVRGNNPGAVEAYDRALKIDPNYFPARFNRGLALFMDEDLTEAIDCARRVVSSNPEFMRAGVALEIWLADAGHSDEAAAVAKAVAARWPADPFAWDILGANDIMHERFQEGVDKIGKARSLGCDGSESLQALTFGMMRLHRIDEAERAATEAIAADPTNGNPLVALGGVRREQKRMEESCALCRKALEMNPANVHALSLLGQNALDMNQLDEAMRHARRILELDPRNSDGWILVGMVEKQRKNYEAAAVAYKKATESSPGNATYWQALAKIAPDYATACEAAKKAQALAPDQSFPQAMLGYVQQKFGKYDEAIASYKDVLKKFPKNDIAGTGIHDSFGHLGRSAEGEAYFLEMTRASPGSALAWQMLGIAHMDLREIPEAREAFLNAANLDPKNPNPLDLLGKIALDAVDKHRAMALGAPIDPAAQSAGTEAESYLRRAISIKPQFAYSHALLCEALFFQQQYSEAEEEGRKAASLSPDLALTWSMLATCLYLEKKFNEAAAAYEKSVRIEPDTFSRWEMMVSSYLLARALPAAEAKVRELCGEFPESAPGWHFIAATCLDTQRYAEAEQDYLKAIALTKENYHSWNGLGLIHSKRDELDQAVECYKKALLQNPKFAESWSNLGYAYFRQDKTAEAIDAYQHALEAQPNHVNALINLAQAAAKIGNMDLARKACAQLGAVNPATAERTRERFLR